MPEDETILFEIIDVDHTAEENLVVAGFARALMTVGDLVWITYGGGEHVFTVKSITRNGQMVYHITSGQSAFVELVGEPGVMIYHAAYLKR